MYCDLQGKHTMTACRVWCGRVQKGCLCDREPKDPAEAGRPGIHCRVPLVSVSEAAALEAWDSCPKATAQTDISLEKWQLAPSSIPIHSAQATSWCHSHPLLPSSNPFSYTQNYASPSVWAFLTQIDITVNHHIFDK